MSCIRKIPLDLFEDKTTYGSAYVDHKKPKDKVYHGPFEHSNEERQRKRKIPVLKTTDTLRPWKCALPFDALWVPKAITRTHPKETFDPNLRLKSGVDKEILGSKPRVKYMSPVVSIDDIKDQKIRNLIVKNMYTSDWKKISGEIPHMCTKRHISGTVLENSSTLMLRYEYDLVKTWPTEFSEKCKKWDEAYPGHVINQTELFWQTFKYPEKAVPAGEDTFKLDHETRKEIRNLIDIDELRIAFDKTKEGYTGYRPNRDAGTLQRKDDYKSPYQQLLKN